MSRETNIGGSPVEGEHIDEVFAATLDQILREGHELEGRKAGERASTQGSREIINSRCSINNTRDRILVHPGRFWNAVEAVARLTWMIAGSDRLADIAFYQQKVGDFSDNGISVPGSNYGMRIVNARPGVNQLEGVIKTLSEDLDSRRAATVIWSPEDAVRQSKAIEAVDFWNLAGRAGRLGKEFEGDVYLIDYEDWPSKPLEGERELVIKSTLETHVHERTEELLTYILDPNSKPDIMGKDPFENTFGKLFFDYRAGRLDETLDRLEVPESSNLRERLAAALKGADSRVGLEDTVVRANPTVSVYRQQRLYDYMLQRIDEKGPEYLMPVHPATKNARQNLLAIFKRCHNEIFQWPSDDDRHKRFSIFAIQWMNGEPLPKIIDRLFAFERARNGSFTIKKAIRQTLDAIEKELRFTYVRLTSCYNTLLARALTEKGHGHLVARIVPIPMYLEVGASSKTMMSFIGLGLSRISARRLSEKAIHQNMEPAEAKAWARWQNLDVLGLSPIIADEIRRTLKLL